MAVMLSSDHVCIISQEVRIRESQVSATITLLDNGATVPFIARYRKEATGSLDEVQIAEVRNRLEQLRELDKRKEAIVKSLEDQGKLTDELKETIKAAPSMAILEDIYLPYRPKRRTRASIAKDKGLEQLAVQIFEQGDFDPLLAAAQFIDSAKGVETTEDALAGARDIIAEMINEHPAVRTEMRELFFTQAQFRCKVVAGKEEEGAKYRDYFDWQEPVSNAPSHRILAMRRGAAEGFLILRAIPEEEAALALIERIIIKNESAAAAQVRMAARDCYKRLLCLSMETELRLAVKKRADEEAIRIFAENLRQLLLAPPLGPKQVLAIDPGFRTGCKVVCLDKQGKLLHHDTIFITPESNIEKAKNTITELVETYQIDAIAIGNGTAGRETEAFVKSLDLPTKIVVVMVNESGASIYSASEAARQEFPDYDVTVRGSVSIGRRLIDPLAELVKIDPKSIGVGQYQHDVDQAQLKKSLDDVVMSCVNAVGVDVNTASVQLLTYVSGLGHQLARSIVTYRNANGPFSSRSELMKVPHLGPKAYEQCAGFLRIIGGKNPLDASAVHPESYPIIYAMADDLHCTVQDLMRDESLRQKINLARYVTDTVGMPTLHDILQELAKPGRDPRRQFDVFSFADEITSIEDLRPGMKLPGIVTNVTAFGAFIDIGVHQDGLVHISRLANKFIKDPSAVVKVHQKVLVTVLDIDLPRKRIALSMKD